MKVEGKKVKKLLILFFAAMVVFTFLSRAADSITVAKVYTDQAKRNELSFGISGHGIVKENMEKNIRPAAGLVIKEVYGETGGKIKKGQTLFTYELEPFNERIEEMERELEKLNFDYKKTEIDALNTANSTEKEVAQMEADRANEDLEAAQAALPEIKENMQKQQEETIKTAKELLEDIKKQKEEAVKTAKRILEDAQADREKLNEPRKKVEDAIALYKSAVVTNNYLGISGQREALFEIFYNGQYKQHESQARAAQMVLNNAEADLSDIIDKWRGLINEADQSSPDEDVRKAYEQAVLNRNAEIKSAKRSIENAEASVAALNLTKDYELDNAIVSYNFSLTSNNLPNQQSTYDRLFTMLYEKIRPERSLIDAADKRVIRAQEDQNSIIDNWAEDEKSKKQEIVKLNEELTSMIEDTYDFADVLKEGQRAVEQAERAVETAELHLRQAEAGEKNALDNKAAQVRSKELLLQGIQMDIESKRQEIEETKVILKDNGKVPSPVSGELLSVDFKQGDSISGQESMIIAVNGYGMEIMADEEEAGYFEEGDEMTITYGAKKTEATTMIERIGAPDENGEVMLTANLPDGNFKVGSSISYSIKKRSETFNCCIPIQALRENDQGKYILVVQEKSGILKSQLHAFRLSVSVIDMDAQYVAIKENLNGEQIITGSNKNLSEGDRVRLND